jgi:integrase
MARTGSPRWMVNMTVVRVKGIKRYCVKGRWFAYHRKTGIRIKAEFGTGEFFAELAALERKLKTAEALPGTLGLLFSAYRASPMYTDLAPTTRHGYGRMMNLLQPINDMPLVELTPQFVAGLRDRIAAKHGRRQANYVMAVISVACEFGKEHGIVRENPVKGVRRVRRSRETPHANRPWTEDERRTVLAEAPYQLRVAVALAMFTGLRKGAIHYSETADTSKQMRRALKNFDPLGSKTRT